ncbi:hypothetical protein MTO96_037728 [Rhipicephalus appendiculatus]
MVQSLPRDVFDDIGIFVNLKKIEALKSVYVSDMVRKTELKVWLEYLREAPLYMRYHVSVPDGAIDKCLNDLAMADYMETAEGLEDDDAAIDNPTYANRLLTLREETHMGRHRIPRHESRRKHHPLPPKAFSTPSPQKSSPSRKSTMATHAASTPSCHPYSMTYFHTGEDFNAE